MTPQKAFQADCSVHGSVDAKLQTVVESKRRVVSDSELDVWTELYPETMHFVRTCRNKGRCGIHDQYLAWIDDRNAPSDLEFLDCGIAIGTHNN